MSDMGQYAPATLRNRDLIPLGFRRNADHPVLVYVIERWPFRFSFALQMTSIVPTGRSEDGTGPSLSRLACVTATRSDPWARKNPILADATSFR